jgi:hypothetical protein
MCSHHNKPGLSSSKLLQFAFGSDESLRTGIQQDQTTSRVMVIKGEQLRSAVLILAALPAVGHFFGVRNVSRLP